MFNISSHRRLIPIIVCDLFSDQVTVFMDSVTIPDEFDPTDDPICFTATAEDNDCLDSGDTVLLEIQDPASPPANVEIADGCGSIGVQALDSDGKPKTSRKEGPFAPKTRSGIPINI